MLQTIGCFTLPTNSFFLLVFLFLSLPLFTRLNGRKLQIFLPLYHHLVIGLLCFYSKEICYFSTTHHCHQLSNSHWLKMFIPHGISKAQENAVHSDGFILHLRQFNTLFSRSRIRSNHPNVSNEEDGVSTLIMKHAKDEENKKRITKESSWFLFVFVSIASCWLLSEMYTSQE